MKHLSFLLLLLICSTAAHANDYAAGVIADNSEFYRERTDKVIREWVEHGTYPDAETVLRIQTLENRFVSMLRLEPSLLNRSPLMHLASVQFRDLRNLPGQFVIARAQSAGLDLWKDSLQGRSFKQASPGGSTETGEWEFENMINACVHWMADGNHDRAVAALHKANELQVYAPPSSRARYLNALLLGGSQSNLSPSLRSTLPRAQ